MRSLWNERNKVKELEMTISAIQTTKWERETAPRAIITDTINSPAWRGETGRIIEWAPKCHYPATFIPDNAPDMRLDLRADEVKFLEA